MQSFASFVVGTSVKITDLNKRLQYITSDYKYIKYIKNNEKY